jgi:hypothetical protein
MNSKLRQSPLLASGVRPRSVRTCPFFPINRTHNDGLKDAELGDGRGERPPDSRR